jgi:hypothetical protein
MNLFLRSMVVLAALTGFAAQAADVTGNWAATVVTVSGQRAYTYAFRQNAGRLIGTVRSPDGVGVISNGYVNHNTVTFTEIVTAEGHRAVHEYTGELVSDTEIKFKRQVAGDAAPPVEFVATRIGTP